MTLTRENIRAALDAIPADLPRDEWARVAMALKSELGADGFELFDAWSQRGASYDAKATRDTWKSVKAGGRVTIGSLIHLAKSHGFKSDDVARSAPATQEELKAAARARAERETRERQEREAAQRGASEEAARIWAAASDSGRSAYLERKGVSGHGVRFAADGWLIVPMRDDAGALWNVQRIAPQRPASGPDKLFLKGGRKSGLWHCIGDPKDVPALMICEGYATGASIHEATGRPVCVAFDAGNLGNVARFAAKAYRPGLLMICGDDDRDTQARSGRNPGREKAQAAAEKVRGVAVWPDGLREDESDFNDMARSLGADKVREHIEAAMVAAQSARQAAKQRGRGASPSGGGDGLPAAPDSSRGQYGALLDRFSVDDEGVWYGEHDNEGRPKAPLWVCSPLYVPALTRDADGQGLGLPAAIQRPGRAAPAMGHAGANAGRRWQ